MRDKSKPWATEWCKKKGLSGSSMADLPICAEVKLESKAAMDELKNEDKNDLEVEPKIEEEH